MTLKNTISLHFLLFYSILMGCGEKSTSSESKTKTTSEVNSGSFGNGDRPTEEIPSISFESEEKIFIPVPGNFGFSETQMAIAKGNIFSALMEALDLAKEFNTFSYAGGELTDLRIDKLTLRERSRETGAMYAALGIDIGSAGGEGEFFAVGVGLDASISYVIDGIAQSTVKRLHLPMHFSTLDNMQIAIDATVDLRKIAKDLGSGALKLLKKLAQSKKGTKLLGETGEKSTEAAEQKQFETELKQVFGAKVGVKDYSNQSLPASASIRLVKTPDGGSSGGTQLAYDILVDILGEACIHYFRAKGVIPANSPCIYKRMPLDSTNFFSKTWKTRYEGLEETQVGPTSSTFSNRIISISTCETLPPKSKVA